MGAIPADAAAFAIAAYVSLNLIVAAIYGVDKIRAQNGSRRISEKTLLVLAVFAPFGALVGMSVFRHKTRKIKFILVSLLMAIHLVAILYIIFG